MQRKYVGLLFVSCALFVLLAGALNLAVDPYGMHRWLDWSGFNRVKPTAQFHTRLAKPYRVLQVHPRTVLLGNSRVEVGLDPQSRIWPAELKPVFNLAIPASGIETSLQVLRHVQHTGDLRLAVVGMDFFDFVFDERNIASHPDHVPEPGELEQRLLVKGDGSVNSTRRLRVLRDHATTTFSLNTLTDSLLTIAAQHRVNQADVTSLGFNPMHEYRHFVRTDGHHALFQQVDSTYISNYLRLKPAIYASGTRSSFQLEQLRSLIAFCRESGIRLILFMHPSHAHVLENYALAGMWPLFEEWKRAVVRIVEEVASPEGGPPVELWDFSGYGEQASEAVPGPMEKGKPMRWYWEAGHYKQELGDLVLARVLGVDVQQVPPEFGVQLNTQNVEAQIEAVRSARAAYSAARVGEIAALERAAQAARQRMPSRDSR
jgi:hypothetical protein